MSISTCPKQPPREPCDGEVGLRNLGGNRFWITVTHDGRNQHLEMSGYNMWRLFGSLSIFLGVKLAKKVGKSINIM